MATLDDLIVPSDEFIEVYASTGQTEGTELELQIKTSWAVCLQEVEVKPSSTSTKGKVVTSRKDGVSVISVLEGSGKVWVRCLNEGSSAKLSVDVL